MNSMKHRGEHAHQQAGSALSLLEQYSGQESAFWVLDHLLMKSKENCEAERLSGHVTRPLSTNCMFKSKPKASLFPNGFPKTTVMATPAHELFATAAIQYTHSFSVQGVHNRHQPAGLLSVPLTHVHWLVLGL